MSERTIVVDTPPTWAAQDLAEHPFLTGRIVEYYAVNRRVGWRPALASCDAIGLGERVILHMIGGATPAMLVRHDAETVFELPDESLTSPRTASRR